MIKTCLLAAALLGTLCVYGAWGQEDCTTRFNETCSNFTNVGVCDNSTGMCYCNETSLDGCFELRDNFCEEARCYSYQEERGECRLGRRSRTATICLSVFLINFGAANFYIARYEYAIPQIILGLLLCFFQFGSCAVAGRRDEDTSVPCIICCSINSVLSLLFLFWWIADIIIFATDQRLDGEGCPLY